MDGCGGVDAVSVGRHTGLGFERSEAEIEESHIRHSNQSQSTGG